MTIEEMQEHLDSLSLDLGCRLDQSPNIPGMMYVEFGYVEGPTIEKGEIWPYPNSQTRYLTCLHELGHFAYGHTQGRPINDYYLEKSFGNYIEAFEDNEFYFNNGILLSEAQAWNFALDRCEIASDELKPKTRSFMWETCLGTYFKGAQSVGFEVPGQSLYNGDRAYINFAYDTPDIYFFQTKRRILEGDAEEDSRIGELGEWATMFETLKDWKVEWIPQ